MAIEDAQVDITIAEKKLLNSALAHINDTIDFTKVATDIEVPNAEAAYVIQMSSLLFLVLTRF
jgi:hypothetical protein